MTRQDALLLDMLALDAEILAGTARDAAGQLVDASAREQLQASFARVFAEIDMAIVRLELDHREISRLAEIESQRFGLAYQLAGKRAS